MGSALRHDGTITCTSGAHLRCLSWSRCCVGVGLALTCSVWVFWTLFIHLHSISTEYINFWAPVLRVQTECSFTFSVEGISFCRFIDFRVIQHFQRFDQCVFLPQVEKWQPPKTLRLHWNSNVRCLLQGEASGFKCMWALCWSRVKCVLLVSGKNSAYQKCRPSLVKFAVHLKYSMKHLETC